jgi:type I restriction enzyme S subunit
VSAELTAQEPSAKYLVNLQSPLVRHFDLIAQAPGGVARLRELILTLAVQGKLVPQDPSDEPASELLKKIRAEKDRLIAEGKIKRDKPLAEITDEEWPFELPAGWVWVRLGEISDFTNGFAFPSAEFSPDTAGVGIVKIGDIQNGLVSNASMSYVSQQYAKSIASAFRVEPGDMLIAMSGATTGKLGFNRKQQIFLLNQRVGKIDLYLVHEKFAYQYLTTKISENLSISAGSAIPNLSTAQIKEIAFPLAPLAEQSRIVTRVEELMQLCDALEASGQLEAQQHAQLVGTLLGTLTQSETPEVLADNWQRIATHFDVLLDRPEAVDALEQTILQLAVRGLLVPQDPTDEPASVLLQKIRIEKDHLIAQGKIKRDKPLPPITDEEKPFELPAGWEWVRLNALLQKIGAGGTPLGGREVYVSSGVKFLRSQNVWDDGLKLASVAYIKPETHAKMSGSVVVANDLLFNITGASIGRCAVVPGDFDEANVSQHVTILRAIIPTLNAFLHKVLVSRHVQQTVMDVQVGVSREGLSIAKLGQFLIPVPPLAEQTRIVTRVSELHSLCADLRQRLVAGQVVQSRLADALT